MDPAPTAAADFEGGPLARASLGRILGLEVSRVLVRGGSEVRISIHAGGGPGVVAIVLAPGEERDAWSRTASGLDLRHEGEALDAAGTALMRQIASGLDRTAFGDLREMAALDPVPAGPAARRAAPAAPGEDRWGRVPCDEWDETSSWRRFVARRELERNCMSALDVRFPIHSITHGDMECRFATPTIDGWTVPVHAYPWIRPLARTGTPRPSTEEALRASRRTLSTDLGDADVIGGGRALLGEALERVAAEAGRDEVVVVKVACLPLVTGEDVRAAIGPRAGRARVFVTDPERKGDDDIVAVLLSQAISRGKRASRRASGRGVGGRARGKAGRRPGHPRVNVVGMPARPAGDRLLELLELAGIAVNARLLPVVDPGEAGRWMEADLQVVVPDPYMEKLVASVFAPLPLEPIDAGPPWGVAGSIRWLEAVARAARRSAAMGEVIGRGMERIGPALDALTSRASDLSLGFVGTAAELASIADPGLMAGIPVAGMIAEMGFSLDLAVFGDGEPGPEGMPQERIRVGRFADAAGLDSLLASMQSRAVYSDFHADRRIGRAGKTPFSLQSFEPGPGGALSTIEALLRASDLPFYARYGRHLGGVGP